jgi:hypothetical protein
MIDSSHKLALHVKIDSDNIHAVLNCTQNTSPGLAQYKAKMPFACGQHLMITAP